MESKRYWNEKMETLDAEEFRKVQEKNLLKELAYVWGKSRWNLAKIRAIRKFSSGILKNY